MSQRLRQMISTAAALALDWPSTINHRVYRPRRPEGLERTEAWFSQTQSSISFALCASLK